MEICAVMRTRKKRTRKKRTKKKQGVGNMRFGLEPTCWLGLALGSTDKLVQKVYY